MIKFPCHCTYLFEVPEEMAGRSLQCPQCGRLNDVPTHDELQQLTDDGTYRIDETPLPESPDRFQQLRRVFERTTVDDEGLEIDLRLSRDQIKAAGRQTPRTEDPILVAPKYDPETGELIRPIEVVSDIAIPLRPEALPMAKTTLEYARPSLNQSYSLFKPLIQLVMPINIAAMFFVLAAHVFLIMMSFSVIVSLLLIFIITFGLVAHYGNVIEEVAIEERDELPRFLRHFSIAEDIWVPFRNVGLALLWCFLPGVLLHAFMPGPLLARNLTLLVTTIAGLVFFPSVILTTTTSGSILNLRPDRVMGTMAQIGGKYFYLMILFPIAFALYWTGIVYTFSHAFSIFAFKTFREFFFKGMAAYMMLLAGIYLMHYFCWLVGLVYRARHELFPWVLQRHVRLIPGVNAPRHLPPSQVPYQRPANSRSR